MSAKTFFIGDLHLGHTNILRFEPYYRPFATIEEHDEEIIKRWNSVVRHSDIVYCMGDMVFGKENMHKLARLNGNKKLIMGNHDCYATADYLKYFHKIYGCLKYNACVVLSHIPVHPCQLNERYKYNIHGHMHSNYVKIGRTDSPDTRYINVSVEHIDLTPISWEQLKEKYFDKEDK